MSLMKSKPTWHKGEIIATERGWVNPKNNEVLVAIGNLKVRLEEEGIFLDEVEDDDANIQKLLAAKTAAPIILPALPKKVYAKQEQKQPKGKEKAVKKDEPKKEIIGEVVEAPVGKQIIAEVVEYDLNEDKKLIAE